LRCRSPARVEFGDDTVNYYDPKHAAGLAAYIQKQSNLVYEAHSTDYQSGVGLKSLVKDHFAILKVGPWLTFALREAIFALENIEKEFLSKGSGSTLSNFQGTLEAVMLKQPDNWKNYYNGAEAQVAVKRKYSFSDRCRYYLPYPEVENSLNKLLSNLKEHKPPMTLISQYLPNQYNAIISGNLELKPEALIRHKIMEVISLYADACGLTKQ